MRQPPAISRLKTNGILRYRSTTIPAVTTKASGNRGACQAPGENSTRGDLVAATTLGAETLGDEAAIVSALLRMTTGIKSGSDGTPSGG